MRISLARPFRKVCRNLSYPAGVAFARFLTGNAVVRSLVFRRDIRQIKEVYEDACGIRLDDHAVRTLLIAKTLKRWRLFGSLDFSEGDLERYVRISGLEQVRERSESGQSVVLASAHYIGVGCLVPVLARLGFDLHTLTRKKNLDNFPGQVRYFFDDGDNIFDGFQNISKVMKSGGLIHGLLDGGRGSGIVAQTFLGRVCQFRRSLFQLALAEGAAIIPVSIRVDMDGCILIDIHQPLSVEKADMTAKAATASLIEGYAKFLEATIRTHPACFDPARIKHFWQRSIADEANAGRAPGTF